MGLHKTSSQHPEIGSVALRMLWIPAIGSVLVVGYLALGSPQVEPAATMAVAAPHQIDSAAPASPTGNAKARAAETAPAMPDETVATHEALDPVGAGHDTSR